MVNFPTRKVGATEIPPFPLTVRCQDERALMCTHENSYPAHPFLLSSAHGPLIQPSETVNSSEICLLPLVTSLGVRALRGKSMACHVPERLLSDSVPFFAFRYRARAPFGWFSLKDTVWRKSPTVRPSLRTAGYENSCDWTF